MRVATNLEKQINLLVNAQAAGIDVGNANAVSIEVGPKPLGRVDQQHRVATEGAYLAQKRPRSRTTAFP